MTPEIVNGCELYLGDCLDVLPTLAAGSVDAVVTDPPYGINWIPRVNNQKYMIGDDKKFDPSPFMNLGRVRLFWGANYFSDVLPCSESWFIWAKQPPTFDDNRKTYAPLEIAWSDIGGKPRIKHHTWDGNFRKGMDYGTFYHPAQKPTELMIWCLEECTQPGDKIFDPFMGSGTTGVACIQTGRRFIGIEKDERYFDIAVKRILQAQPPLFVDAPAVPVAIQLEFTK